MAFFNYFFNFNINFSQPRFNFNFGCFSLPNFSTIQPFFRGICCFNKFNTINAYRSPNILLSQSWQPYTNQMLYNIPSVFDTIPTYNAPNLSFNNTFNQDDFNYTWENNFITAPQSFLNNNIDTFHSRVVSNEKRTTTTTTTPPASSDLSSTEKAISSTIEDSKDLKLCEIAESYSGKVNSDAEGNRLFSPNQKKQAWCADFVTYVTKKAYGTNLPTDFGSSSVSSLRSWAINNSCYKKMPSYNKENYIAQNIKPGDIMIEKENGKSHTGIVVKVNSDGSFDTIEGNIGKEGKVGKKTYTAQSPTLSGFISLSKYT